jgi:UDP-N-acetylglucosamine 2-epimerase
VLSQLLFCPTASAVENLAEEGITRGVHRSGDVMYDSVLFNAALAKRSSDALKQMNLQPKSFYLATLHRAENTDEPALLAGILQAFAQVQHPIVLPMHPRTRKVLGPRISAMPAHIRVVDPLNYLDMLVLESNARLILTDSGGVQKEAYWLDVPCVTLREETEWVELVEAGCNVTVGADPARIIDAVQRFEREGLPLQRRQDLYGDGHAAEKIVAIMAETFACQ